jgi:hypothetical protein
MSTTALKQAIAEDIEILKHLDVDIMEKDLYYREIRRLSWMVFLLLSLPTMVAEIIYLPLDWALFSKNPMDSTRFILLIPSFISLLFLVGLFGLISEVVIFKHQLKPHLQTGELLYQKALKVWRVPYAIYAMSILLITPCFGWWSAGAVEFGSALVVPVILKIMIDLEINRIGVSTLFTVIKKYFESN